VHLRDFIVNAAPPASILLAGVATYCIKIVFYNLNRSKFDNKLGKINNYMSDPSLDTDSIKMLADERANTLKSILENESSLIINITNEDD
jgi:hypothetical protein